MITITIDNQSYQVKEGQNLLQACLTLGFDLPYFCWHPALHSVGACRQCAVKLFRDEKDTRGRIVMSCMTPVAANMRLSIADAEARAFRSSVIEWLMINHPHDCPVCDEGGECHLQDMTVMTGHAYRRYRFTKRTHRNQDLGPFINHEMNRCIACYRCVRYYADVAGGSDLVALGAHDHVYFGRHEDGALESAFSGNLVEICPTGVFTDKTFKQRYTRKWDLQTAPSVCVHCGLGCNIIAGERYGTLRRVLNRYHHDVNGYFLCDRGRFGYGFVNSGKRIKRPLVRQDGTATLVPGGREEAFSRAAGLFRPNAGLMGIGSPRASLEANYALRSLVGPDRFFAGVSGVEHRLVRLIVDILQKGPAASASIEEVAGSDAVLVLGEDLTNTAPLLALAVRRSVYNQPRERLRAMGIPDWDRNAFLTAVQDRTGPLYLACPSGTKLDDIATKLHQAGAGGIARFAGAVAAALDPELPQPSNLRESTFKKAGDIAEGLRLAKRPVIIAGTSLASGEVIRSAANIAWALVRLGVPAKLCFTVPECNSLGLALMEEKSLADAIEAGRRGSTDGVVVLENDLFLRADERSVTELLGSSRQVLAIDHVIQRSALAADLILPAAAFAESDGTLVNNEGRAQRFYKVYLPELDIRESWKWIGDLIGLRDGSAPWRDLDEIARSMADDLPQFQPLLEAFPRSTDRFTGQKAPRQPHRSSGRTAMTAQVSVHEPAPPQDDDSALAFSMEGADRYPPALLGRYWSPGWNSVQALNKFQQEINGPLRGGDPGCRLIAQGNGPVQYFHDEPQAFRTQEGKWLIVPVYELFGSEELSSLSPPMAGLAPLPYLALNDGDAAELGVTGEQRVELTTEGRVRILHVRISALMPAGMAGLYSGTARYPETEAPVFGTIARV